MTKDTGYFISCHTVKDITPAQFKCEITFSCPAVYELDDGSLLIIGKRAPLDVLRPLMRAGKMDTATESAIIIDPALLADVKRP